MTDLFDPFEAGGLRLQNRIALSPLTRTRADMAGKPGMSFDEVRAALGKDEKALPDGAIHQIALDAGFKVEP